MPFLSVREMGVEKQGSKGGGGKVGGFLQLFDWNGRSRKKLFSSKSDPPVEGSKQGKRSHTNLPMTRLHLINEDDNGGSSIKGNSDYSCASSVTDDEGNGARAPGVVARLMGLDSLPTYSVAEPYSTPFSSTQSFRDAHSHSYRKDPELLNEYESMHSNYQPTKLGGFSQNLVESRPQKLHNRPIERFQTEILPPKSAKFIPITQHKLLSPIKNPSFTPTKNAAHIMEAATKIIELGPQVSTKEKNSSLGSSFRLRVQDLKDKMVAERQPSSLPNLSRRLVESNAVKSLKGQSLTKSWNGSEDSPQFRASPDSEERSAVGFKSKGKPLSLAIPAKVNCQRKEGLSSKKLLGQKEHHGIKPNQPFKSQPNTQKNIQKKSSIHISSAVLRQNNQKQNCLVKDTLPSKPSVTNLKGKKALSSDASPGHSKTSNKVAGNSKVGSGKIGLEKADIVKEVQSTRTKNLPRNKRPIEKDCHFEKGGFMGTVLVDKKEKPIQPNVAIDGHLKRLEDNRRKGLDVVSFTFTSPMVKSMPGTHSSSQVVEKNNSFSLDSHSKKNPAHSRNTKLSSLGLNVIQGDSLSIRLEQKLRELTCGVESSCHNSVKSGSVVTDSILQGLVSALNAASSTSMEHDKFGLHTDNSSCLYDSDCSSNCGHMLKMSHKEQAVEMDMYTSSNIKGRKELDLQHPSPVSILEPSFSNESYNSSDSGDNNSVKGSMQCSSIQDERVVDSICPNMLPLVEAETDISDSASSTFTETVSREHVNRFSTSYHTKSDKKKLEYVREILCNVESMFKNFTLGRAPEIINPLLFDQLEKTWSRSDAEDKNSRLRRKVLFDCVTECLDLRCRQYVGGGCRTWAKGVAMVQREGWLAEEVYKEISGWGSMVDWMVDELMDKDMSTQHGRWLDFKIQEFEVGIEIERSILCSLVDEVVADI